MRIFHQFLGDLDCGEIDWLFVGSLLWKGEIPFTVAQLISFIGALIVNSYEKVIDNWRILRNSR